MIFIKLDSSRNDDCKNIYVKLTLEGRSPELISVKGENKHIIYKL